MPSKGRKQPVKDINNIVVVSDIHAGCRLALCPPDGNRLDDGGFYQPSDFQLKIWQYWQYFWEEFVPVATRNEPYAIVINGDAREGMHHRATTPISQNPKDQERIAYNILRPLVDKCEGRFYMVRGTEAHVGNSAEAEEGLAERLGAVPNKEGQFARYELWKRCGPKLGHFLHHVGTTGSNAYESTAVHKELIESYTEAARWHREPPDFIGRAHRHRHYELTIATGDDDGNTSRAYSFVTPAWQGKMLALDTPLPTPDGWTTMGDVKTGDTVFDENGSRCKVTAVLPVDQTPESYEVKFSNGEIIKACGDHLWLTTAQVDRPGESGSRYDVRPLTRVRNTREIRETLRFGASKRINHSIPMPGSLDLPDTDLPIDPYILGCWIGDGSSDAAQITCSLVDFEHFRHEFRKAGFLLKQKLTLPWKCPTFSMMRVSDTGGPVSKGDQSNLQRQLRGSGLLYNKHIPGVYLRSSHAQRLALLQGMMDTDGYAESRVCEFVTVSPVIRDGMCDLLASLGLKYTCVEKLVPQARTGMAYRIRFFSSPDFMPVFRMQRKLDRIPLASDRDSAQRSRTVQILSVEPCAPVPMRCIAVDSPSHLYRCGRTMLPTHNTPFAWKVAGARLTTPQFGGVVVRYTDGELFLRSKVWTAQRDPVD